MLALRPTKEDDSSLLGMPSVLQAASPLAREPWKPRPGDGISSTWLIAELTHRQAHGLDSQIPMEADR